MLEQRTNQEGRGPRKSNRSETMRLNRLAREQGFDSYAAYLLALKELFSNTNRSFPGQGEPIPVEQQFNDWTEIM